MKKRSLFIISLLFQIFISPALAGLIFGDMGLNDANWDNRYVAVRKLGGHLSDENLKNMELKNALTRLLKSEIDFREKYIRGMLLKGIKNMEATNNFYQEYSREGRYIKYINGLYSLVIKYRDVEAIPLLLDCIRYYGSDEVNYYAIIYLGKAASDRLRDIIKGDNERRKEIALQTLAIWINASLVNEVNNTEQGELSTELKLKSQEIRAIKNDMIAGLKTENPTQIYFIN